MAQDHNQRDETETPKRPLGAQTRQILEDRLNVADSPLAVLIQWLQGTLDRENPDPLHADKEQPPEKKRR